MNNGRPTSLLHHDQQPKQLIALSEARILHVTHAYAPSIGGTERLVQGISEYLHSTAALNVTVLASWPGVGASAINSHQSLPRRDFINGVPVVRARVFPTVERVLSWIYKLPGGWRVLMRCFPGLSRDPLTPGLTREILNQHPDLVMSAAIPTSACIHAYLARRRRRFRWVVMPACPVEWWERDVYGISSGLEWTLLQSADVIFALTDAEAEYFSSQGIPSNRIVVIGAGTDEMVRATYMRESHNPFRNPAGPKVAFVGRVVPGKGLDVLLQGMPLVWEQLSNTTLLVAGPTTERGKRLLAEHRDILEKGGSRVRILGPCDDTVKSQLYDACNVFALPSRIESFGMVYVEAWAHGKPVIGCRTASTASLITDNTDGLLVSYGDPRALADAILKLLKNPELAARLGEAGRAKAIRSYTWQAVGAKVYSAYAKLIAGEKVEGAHSTVSR